MKKTDIFSGRPAIQFFSIILILVIVFGLRSASANNRDKSTDIDAVLAYFSAIDTSDSAKIPELFAADATQEFMGNDPIVGVDAIKSQFELSLAQLQSMKTDVIDMVAENGVVGIHVKHTAVFKAGGAFKNRAGIVPPMVIFQEPVDVVWQAMALFRLKDGMITEEIIIRDELSILTQVGTLSLETP